MAVGTVNIDLSGCVCHSHVDVTIDGEVHSVVIDKNELKDLLADTDLIKTLILRNMITYYQKRKAENATKAEIIVEINAREFKY